MAISRRSLFQAGSGVFGCLSPNLALAFDRQSSKEALRRTLERNSEVFAYGVASGDPLSDRVILWTHVTGEGDLDIPVRWEVALDSRFESVIAEGNEIAKEESDFTVKVDAILPYPGMSYFYRFQALGAVSQIGRTRTAPKESTHLRLAVVSCSSIWSGYFNSYEKLAQRSDLDLIIHCGDYAYDVPDPDEKRNMPYRVQNTLKPQNLHDHRQRYRYYRRNSLLQAVHQQHPFAIIWDNHDIWTDAPRSEAIQAFWEWQPVRAPSQDQNQLFRALDFGSLLKIYMLDTRHYGRGQVISGTEDRSILGDEQFQWLQDELLTSRGQWNVIASQVLFSKFTALNKPLTSDSWQGFSRDAERVRQLLKEDSVTNPIIVSGDAHLSFACNIEEKGENAGVEFLPSSVTRGNLDENVAKFLAPLLKNVVEGAVKFFNPHIRYFEAESHGYGIVDLTQTEAKLEFWYVDHVDRTSQETCARSLVIADGARRITSEFASASTPKAGNYLPAPRPLRLYEKGLEIGGAGGEYFDGEERLERDSCLVGLAIAVDNKNRLKALRFSYKNGFSWQMGKSESGNSFVQVPFQDGEYLRSLKLGMESYKKMTLVTSIGFTTNMGRVENFGSSDAKTLEFRAPEGFHIVSFHGRSGSYIDKLGPIFAPDF